MWVMTSGVREREWGDDIGSGALERREVRVQGWQ